MIKLLEQVGFEFYGIKNSEQNEENVYVKNMQKMSGYICKDFPFINVMNNRKFILSIYPKYHSVMFPDSILTTESKDILADISYTNSIHKIYICTMNDIDQLCHGDVLVLYRTAQDGKNAEYSAVATSVCMVEEVKKQDEFDSFDTFYQYASQYTIFDKTDLKKWYDMGKCKTIKMTYNAALKKRIVRHELIENFGLDRNQYWGFFELTDRQFFDICEKGKVSHLLKKYEQTFV